MTLSPVEGRDRNGGDLGETEPGGEGLVVPADFLEALGAVVDQVHLVDRQHHVADADQRDQVAVAPGLGQHPLAGVDEDHRHLGGGGAGDHVAGVLLVAGGVGDDELALVGGEEAVGDVDGDPLLALGLQAVEEQGVVDLSPWVPTRLLSASRAASWSSKISFESQSSRPIRVLLPSSTLPQVMKRSIAFSSWLFR